MAKKPIPQATPSAQAASVASPPSANADAAELPVATIEFAQNNSVLYPLDAAQGTTATLTLPAGSTQVVVHFAIKDQAAPTFPPIGVASGDVAEIPWQWISTCIGHTVLIWYEAVVGGVRKVSLVLELEIQQVREADLRESMPEFAHAKVEWSTLWLDMFTFEGNETIRIKAWPMIQAGQRLFVVVAGNQHQVPFRFTWVAYDHLVTAAEAHSGFVFEFSLSRGWLSRLEDYSSLTCHLGVIWDGTAPGDPVSADNPLPDNAQDFHQRSTTLLRVNPQLDLAAPHLRESVEVHPDDWQVNPINTVTGGHVIIAYEGMTEGDQVCVHAYGANYGPVSLGCQEVTTEDSSLSFDLAPEIIAALFNQEMTLNYSVQFNNYLPQFSPDRAIKVLSPQLTTPSIEEATAGKVDLTTFKGNATGLVSIWDYAAQGQCCWMWVSGVSADDIPYRFDILMDEPLTAQWLRDGVDAPIPRAELKKLADCGEFALHFAASFDSTCNRATALEFTPKSFKIVQEHMVLLAPTVTEAVGSDLTAWNGHDGVHVEVDYDGITPKHNISVCWKRRNGTCWPLDAKPGSTAGSVVFFLPPEAVIESIGQTVSITYTVNTACKVQTSLPLNLNISQPTGLKRPNVLEATPPATEGAILDLNAFTGNANSLENPMWFLRAGQKCWLRAAGTDKSGNAYSFDVYAARIIGEGEAAEGVAGPIMRSELDKLKDTSNVIFTFSVATDGSSDENVVCPSRKLIVHAPAPMHDFSPFTGGNWNGWGPGAAAYRPVDLVMTNYGGNWVLVHDTSDTRVGELVKKRYTELVVGQDYEFGIKVQNRNGFSPVPTLSLQATDGSTVINITRPMQFPSTTWVPLKGSFRATATSMLLSVHTHQSVPIGGDGDDYNLDDFEVRSI